MAGPWCVHHNQRFLVFILVFISIVNNSSAVTEHLLTCGQSLDLSINVQTHSGVIKVQMPKDFSLYQGLSSNTPHCDITVMFGAGIHLQLELYYLDIVPVSSNQDKCSTGLMVMEAGNKEVYGGRLCMKGWEWEKKQRENKQEKKVVKDSPLTFRLISEGPFKGTGFKVHFNKFRPFWPCSSHREFKCERLQRCVHDDLTCDSWDDCGDDSDEDEDAGCELLTVSEIFAVLIGVFHFVGTVAATVVFFIKYRTVYKRYTLEKKASKMALDEERRSMREPSVVFPHRFNSMESVNKSHYSRSQKMDLDSLMDRMELDKADKFSCKDNMSERSYKSNATRRSRMAREKAGIMGNSNPNLDKETTEKDGEKREKGRSGREEGRDPERRRSRKYSDEEEEDYDSDRERRRRRRSRDRRRYERSDDEDYDSDYGRRRGRRSRSRYDSEDEEDSDRERRRRRRNRRYDDESDEDFDSDSDRRRRRRRRRRYDSDDYDSDGERKSRSRRNLEDDEEGEKGDSDKEKRRRRRSRERRRYDSDDDYDSDRDRRRRRSRDRRSRDVSRDKLDKESQSRHGSQDKLDKESVKLQSDNVDNDKARISTPESKPKKLIPDRSPQPNQPHTGEFSPPPKPLYTQPMRTPPPPKQEVAHNPSVSSPLPSNDDKNRYNKRRTPRSDTVSPVPPQAPNNGSTWVPRSERKRNRRSRGDPVQQAEDDDRHDIYEDVVPKVQQENLGFREEAV